MDYQPGDYVRIKPTSHHPCRGECGTVVSTKGVGDSPDAVLLTRPDWHAHGFFVWAPADELEPATPPPAATE